MPTMTPPRTESTALASTAAAAAAAYAGQTFPIAAWRGETVYCPVEDRYALAALTCLHGFHQDGISITLGSAQPVSYRESATSPQIRSRIDCLQFFDASQPIPPNQGVNLYARICVGPQVEPKTYAIGPLALRVVNETLPPPDQWHYFLDLWQHPWAVSRFFNLTPFSPEHYAAMEPIWKTLAACGQKALTVTLLDLPWNHQCYDAYHSLIGRIKKTDGSWAFDYTRFDAYVEFGRRCGIGPDIACYTLCPWGYIVRWKNEAGESCHCEALPGTPEFSDYWGDFLTDFAAHLKAKGWFQDTYIAMDERTPEDVQIIAQFVQSKAPGMKIAMAGNLKPSDFKGITIDNFSQILDQIPEDYPKELQLRHQAGFKTTFYVCLFPKRPNTLMDSPDEEGYWLGAYPALFGFDGFLRWAANSWPSNPYQDASCSPFPPGDVHLVYPRGEFSTRLISLRAGIIAAEKANRLKAQGRYLKEIETLAQNFPFQKAVEGSLDLLAFQSQFNALVNP